MNGQSKNIGLIDLDGTLVDYHLALQRDLDSMRSPNEDRYIIGSQNRHPDYIYARMESIKSRGEWWENLPKLQLGFDILDILLKLNYYVSVLTQGPKDNTIAWSHKLKWCIKNIPDIDVTITRNKGIVYGKVLVDDYIPYIEQWLAHRPRGLVIMPAHEWNKDYTPTSNIIRYDGSNLDQIEEALAKVRQRKAGEPLAL
jgi:5'-nucleotidase